LVPLTLDVVCTVYSVLSLKSSQCLVAEELDPD